jgi:oxalate decarboxylase
MKFSLISCVLIGAAIATPLSQQAPAERRNKHLRPVLGKRDDSTATGQPIRSGLGGPLLGGTNHQIDLQNPANLGSEATDAGVVPNLVWSFSNSHTRLLSGGWVREQVVTDLPSSKDIAAAQQHLVS